MATSDVVYFDHEGNECKDRYHRRCTGRSRGELNLDKDSQGKGRRRKVSAKTKAEVQSKLEELRQEEHVGVRSSATYTVTDAVEDWLAGPMSGRAAKTAQTAREVTAPVLDEIGKTVLRDLRADDVGRALRATAGTRSTRTVQLARAALVRAISYAQARGQVRQNVASLIDAPPGKAPGRPARSLTVTQARAVLKAAEDDRIGAYFVLSLYTGIRTEEARVMRWDHVNLDGDVPQIQVWRSVRAGGDVKTRRSRRTLALPSRAVAALEAHRELQDTERENAGPLCRSMASCSPHNSAGHWTRIMSGERSSGSARRRRSGVTGRRGTSGTASSACSRSQAFESSGSRTWWATRTDLGSQRRSIARCWGQCSRRAPR
jgi:integrase